jgi:hypothetical protein
MNNNNKIKQLILLLITIPLLTSCIGHDTKHPVEFEAYSYHVTMDKDGTITYRKVTSQEEHSDNNAN